MRIQNSSLLNTLNKTFNRLTRIKKFQVGLLGLVIVGLIASLVLVGITQDVRQQASVDTYNIGQCCAGGQTFSMTPGECTAAKGTIGACSKVSKPASKPNQSGSEQNRELEVDSYVASFSDLPGCGGHGQFPCAGSGCNQGYEIDSLIGTCFARGAGDQQSVLYGACLKTGKTLAECEDVAFGGQGFMGSQAGAVTKLCIDYVESKHDSYADPQEVSNCQLLAQILIDTSNGKNILNFGQSTVNIDPDNMVLRDEFIADVINELKGDDFANSDATGAFIESCWKLIFNEDFFTITYVGSQTGSSIGNICYDVTRTEIVDNNEELRVSPDYELPQDNTDTYFSLTDSCQEYALEEGLPISRDVCSSAAVESVAVKEVTFSGADAHQPVLHEDVSENKALYYNEFFPGQEVTDELIGYRLARCLALITTDDCAIFPTVKNNFYQQCLSEDQIPDWQCEQFFENANSAESAAAVTMCIKGGTVRYTQKVDPTCSISVCDLAVTESAGACDEIKAQIITLETDVEQPYNESFSACAAQGYRYADCESAYQSFDEIDQNYVAQCIQPLDTAQNSDVCQKLTELLPGYEFPIEQETRDSSPIESAEPVQVVADSAESSDPIQLASSQCEDQGYTAAQCQTIFEQYTDTQLVEVMKCITNAPDKIVRICDKVKQSLPQRDAGSAPVTTVIVEADTTVEQPTVPSWAMSACEDNLSNEECNDIFQEFGQANIAGVVLCLRKSPSRDLDLCGEVSDHLRGRNQQESSSSQRVATVTVQKNEPKTIEPKVSDEENPGEEQVASEVSIQKATTIALQIATGNSMSVIINLLYEYFRELL